MHQLFGYVFLIVLIQPPLFSAKRGSSKRVKQCCAGKSTKDSCEYLELSCTPGYVIYKPDVYPTSLSCSNGHHCYGVDIPYTDLRVDILNCYWKNKCLIDLSSILRTYYFHRVVEKCPSFQWQNVMVKDWKCVPEAVISDICAGNRTLSINPNKTSGIVRSHERFPWEYGKDLFRLENGRYAPRCTVIFNGYLQSNMNFSRVAIFVDSLDIGDDVNTAYIRDEELEENKTYSYDFKTGHVNITFGLTLTDNNIKGGSGFVLYYKFLKVGETVSSVNDLRDVIETKQGSSAKCIHDHQYFCPFRKMCETKKAKLFVPQNDPNNFCTYHSIRKAGKLKHCLKKDNYDACNVRKEAFKGRKWQMIITGNLTERFFTCQWMLKAPKCKRGTTWTIRFVSNSIDTRFDNLTVKHFRCKNQLTKTTLVPRNPPYKMDEGDVLIVEYSRRTDNWTESDTWLAPNTDFKMIFQRRKRKGKE